MLHKILFITLLFLLNAASLMAQNKLLSKFVENAYDSTYIEDYSSYLTTRMLLINRNLNLLAKDRLQNSTLNYMPNSEIAFGVGMAYGIFGGQLSMRILRDQSRRNERYGKTDYFDLQFNGYGSKFGMDLTLQTYKGFYISNAFSVDPQWTKGMAYPQRPDLSTRNLGLNFYYIRNSKKFSYQSSFNHTKKQKKSAGSLILMGALSQLYLVGDSSITLVHRTSEEPVQAGFNKGKFYTLAALPGYAYTLVHKSFYVTGALCIGAGLQYQSFSLNDRDENRISLTPQTNVRLATGYNGRKVVSGVSFVLDNKQTYFENIRLSATAYHYKIFLGYRF